MNFLKINGLKDVYPESIEGTNEWYFCKLAKDNFCDLYEAEEIVNSGNIYKGMNCVLIHFPDGTVYYPFEMMENVYVDAPIFWDGILYFLVVDFNVGWVKVISFDPKDGGKNIVKELSLNEVGDCYNLMLRVTPITLIRYGNDGVLNIIWPEKKKIALRECETMLFRDDNKLYCSEWYEDPDYHEKVIVRDWNTGEIKECFGGQMCRMPNGDIWIL